MWDLCPRAPIFPDMADLFAGFEPEAAPEIIHANAPLADRLRPQLLAEVVGQEHLTGPDGAIGRMVAAGKLSSMILWGPPGTGKTTSRGCSPMRWACASSRSSAVFSGVADLKKVSPKRASMRRIGKPPCCSWTRSTASTAPSRTASCPMSRTAPCAGRRDHRNPLLRAQRRAAEPRAGPDPEPARCAALTKLLDRAEELEGRPLPLTPEARDAMVARADGDGRFLLNQAETLFSIDLPDPLDPAALGQLLQRRVAVYDKDREGHYNLISRAA